VTTKTSEELINTNINKTTHTKTERKGEGRRDEKEEDRVIVVEQPLPELEMPRSSTPA
jgi:hypothetical protein